jgi:tellurite resistance protein
MANEIDDETKRLICRMVAGLVASDEDFTETERTFVEKVLANFGIPEEEWDAIFPLVSPAEARNEISKLTGAARETAVNLLVQAAAADGKIVAEEREYLDAVADAMSIHSTVMEFRLNKAMASDGPLSSRAALHASSG